jgi:hypothetical protein
VRVVLEEAGGGGDVGGFDDQKPAIWFCASAMPDLATRLVLPTITSARWCRRRWRSWANSTPRGGLGLGAWR